MRSSVDYEFAGKANCFRDPRRARRCPPRLAQSQFPHLLEMPCAPCIASSGAVSCQLFLQQDSMTAANARTVSHDKPGLTGGFELRIPQCGLHVANRLGKQNEAAGLQSTREFGKKRTRGRHFMHDRKGKCEIHRTCQVCQPHGVGLNQADIHSL